MLFRLILFHLRETLTVRTLAFFAAVLLLTLFILSALPSFTEGHDRISYNLSLSIVDPEASLISQSLAGILEGMSGMGSVHIEDMATAQKRLDNNEILMIISIPPGFFESEAWAHATRSSCMSTRACRRKRPSLSARCAA